MGSRHYSGAHGSRPQSMSVDHEEGVNTRPLRTGTGLGTKAGATNIDAVETSVKVSRRRRRLCAHRVGRNQGTLPGFAAPMAGENILSPRRSLESIIGFSNSATAIPVRVAEVGVRPDLDQRRHEDESCHREETSSNPIQKPDQTLQEGSSLAPEVKVPWRRIGDPCPVCARPSCLPEHHYITIQTPAFDDLDGRTKKHVLDNLYNGDVQPKSHTRLEILRADGIMRTIYVRDAVVRCNGCNGTRTNKKPCQDIATGLTWIGLMTPPKGEAPGPGRVRNQAAWDLMANNWYQDFPGEVRRLVEAAVPYMPKSWFRGTINPVDRIISAIRMTDNGKALRYAGSCIKEWAADGSLERPFSYGTLQATKDFEGIHGFLHNLRRLGTMPFSHLTVSFGSDASGLPGGPGAAYNKERGVTRERDDKKTRTTVMYKFKEERRKKKGQKPKISVGDKPYNMVMFGNIRETCMIAEMGFFRKKLKDIVKEGVHRDAKGKVIIRGEQPWVVPMLINVKTLHPTLQEYHGDKGEYSDKLFMAGEKLGVTIDVEHKSNFEPAESGGTFSSPKAAATRKFYKDLEDPEAFLDRLYQREIDEGIFGGIKRELRSYLRNIKPEHQEVETLLFGLKWNIKWALYEKYNRSIHADYRPHAARVFESGLLSLEEQALRYDGKRGVSVLTHDLAGRSQARFPAAVAAEGT